MKVLKKYYRDIVFALLIALFSLMGTLGEQNRTPIVVHAMSAGSYQPVHALNEKASKISLSLPTRKLQVVDMKSGCKIVGTELSTEPVWGWGEPCEDWTCGGDGNPCKPGEAPACRSYTWQILSCKPAPAQ